jgi:filamentous hemagglutinin
LGQSATAQTVARVQGLPSTAATARTGKYLIETNPVLTDLKQFMSSDYLLAGLGYNPDESAKRLGDGLYEQRLVQQAVTSRTGQAFIDGQTSNGDQFKYLMNNAIASKTQLNLTVGVSLTSEQVAALTHDIVWLEEREVNGENVLVPVLYLAQADGRLAPNGALIAGRDVTLIAGQNLDNVGTLKATHNLSATAGNDLVNSGLISAGNRLDLLAGNDVTNKAGGIIAGRDVTVTAIGGDVTNERSVTSLDSDVRGQLHKEYADNAARIEAANDLSVSAGRDINNIGSTLQAGRDLALNAGRDVNTASTQLTDSLVLNSKHTSSDITQIGSTVSAGRDLSVQAGRDINAIASQIDAKRDIAMAATEDVTISSAADEEHSYSKSKKVKRQEDHVSQVQTEITAGGSVAVSAGQDLTLISSRITAGDEAYLAAGDKLGVFAAQDNDHSLYDMKKKGSFGAKKTKHDEVTQVTNVSSEITSGGDMVLVSGGNQHYQAAKINSGDDLSIKSGGSIAFDAVKDLHQESHEKSNTSLSWNSMSGKGSTDETLRQSELIAKGKTVIDAVDGLHIDIKQINKESVSEAINAMVKADPNLAWLKDAEARGDVDWKLIKETHDSYKYSSSSLGQGAMLAIIIIVTILTAGAASAAAGTVAGAGAGSGTAMAAGGSAAMVQAGTAVGTAAAGWGNVAATAALTSLAGTAAVSVINNKGNLGNTVKDTFSSNSLKNALIASVTAGMIDYADHNWFASAGEAANGGSKVITAGPTQNPGYASSMLQPDSWTNTLARSGTHALINSGVSTAVNGGSFGSNLGGALVSEGIDLGAAAGNNAIHKLADGLGVAPAIAEKMVLHAALGGLIAKARGEDFASGAIAGGVAEGLTPIANAALAEFVSARFNPSDMSVEGSQYKIATAQIIGLIAAGAAGGNPATGSLIGGTGERYNEQGFQDPTSMFDENSMPLQKSSPEIDKVKEQVSLAILGILFPAALEEMAAGTLAKIAGMFSQSAEEGALAGASSGGRAVGAVDAGAGAGEAVTESEEVAAEAVNAAGGGAKDAVPNPGKTAVYVSTAEDGTVQYVGITDNLEARSAAHLSQKGIEIDAIPGLQNISRSDARAVEQVLIEYNGLGKNGGSLINKINSISTANPIYAKSLSRGVDLLKTVGYPGFK